MFLFGILYTSIFEYIHYYYYHILSERRFSCRILQSAFS